MIKMTDLQFLFVSFLTPLCNFWGKAILGWRYFPEEGIFFLALVSGIWHLALGIDDLVGDDMGIEY